MSKYKHKAVKDLSDQVKEHRKIDYTIQEKMKTEKALAMKVKIVDEVLRGPKHKVPERTAIFDPKTEELITDENEILAPVIIYATYQGLIFHFTVGGGTWYQKRGNDA